MSDSSSEDEQDANRLREAIAVDLISDDLYTGSKKSTEKPDHTLKSLRNTTHEEENHFDELPVTPQFRQYVAKHLSLIMDASLEKKLTNKSSISPVHKNKKKGGVKLFSNSVSYIKRTKTDTKQLGLSKSVLKQTANRYSYEDVSQDDLKCVIIEPEDIKKETLHWSNRSKAPVYHYKRNKNGQLDLIE